MTNQLLFILILALANLLANLFLMGCGLNSRQRGVAALCDLSNPKLFEIIEGRIEE